jgi:phage terminase small subunit
MRALPPGGGGLENVASRVRDRPSPSYLNAAGFEKVLHDGFQRSSPEASEGNPGKRPITAPVVEATGDVFVPPHLEPAAKACIEVILASMPPGTYAGSDTFLLAAFATAWSLHRKAVVEIGKPDFEHVVKSARGGRQLNPWLRVLSTVSTSPVRPVVPLTVSIGSSASIFR